MVMAKAKTPKETVVEYFQSIKYFQEDGKLIVILPEGLKVDKSELKDKKLDLELFIEELNGVLIVAELDAPAKADDLLVLQAEDAKGFGDE